MHAARRFWAVASLLVAAACARSDAGERARADTPVHGVDLAYRDTTCAPCRAFYEHANGDWIKRAAPRANRPAIGALDEMQDRAVHVLHAILDSLSAADVPRESVGWKVGRFYASCMDSRRVEREGAAPLRAELARIDSIASLPALRDEAARLNRAGIGVLFTFAAVPDPKQSAVVIGDLSAGGVSLPGAEYYLRDDPATRRVRDTYRAALTQLLELSGASVDRARAEAAQALAIETSLARASRLASDGHDPTASYHKLGAGALAALTPHWSWAAYFDTLAGQSHPHDSPAPSPIASAINVQQPPYFRAVDRMLDSLPLAAWKSYLRTQYLATAASHLSAPFARAIGAVIVAVGGSPPPVERWRYCEQETDQSLGNALGQEYVRRAFTPGAKVRVLALIHNIEDVLHADLDTLSWMGEGTRRQAVAKLDRFVVKIGYPERWPDYSALDVRDTSLWSNVVAAAQLGSDHQLATLGRPVDRSDLQYTPQTVDAYFNPRRNEVGFAAGYLQPPFFDSLADDASNYGGIGVVIGHELTHAFDEQGRRYDETGNLRNWWTPADDSSFRRRAALLVRQYDGYIAVDTLHINGAQTLSENLADLGGVVLAYRALERALGDTPRRTIDGMTPEQRFFLAYAQSRRGVYSPDYLRNKVLTNNHAPDKWRVLGPIEDMTEFAAAFHCRPGDPMVRPDSLRVRIW